MISAGEVYPYFLIMSTVAFARAKRSAGCHKDYKPNSNKSKNAKNEKPIRKDNVAAKKISMSEKS